MSIPTDDDFTRATRLMAARDANWDEIHATAHGKLLQVADIHHFALFPKGKCDFAAIVFFSTDRALAEAKARGFDAIARQLVEKSAAQFRAGECSKYDILIELDSYENVKRNFGGSYFNRLR